MPLDQDGLCFMLCVCICVSSGIYFKYDDQSKGLFGNTKLWNGNCQPGQLTRIGGEMCTRMGAGLREVYVEKFHLLPQTLTENDVSLLELHTTDIARTHESLVSVMEGLYPADRRSGVYIPVAVTPSEITSGPLSCKRVFQLLALNLQSKEWVSRYQDLKPSLDQINEICDAVNSSEFNTGYSAGGWPDVFHARECHNMPLPCSQDGKTCVDDKMADKVFDFTNWMTCRMFAGDEMNRLTSGAVFMGIADNFKSFVSSGKGPKYIHYSDHDTTIAMALAALKYNCESPPYASTLRFELWQTESGSSPKYAVQIIYNNNVIRPPECSDNMCPLDDFLGMVKSRLTIHDPVKECQQK